eukprot:m.233457 g.233457  ORF g.233457 m.233457 type:complete len:365 (-) comp19295_c0_seq1:362-1456(-)
MNSPMGTKCAVVWFALLVFVLPEVTVRAQVITSPVEGPNGHYYALIGARTGMDDALAAAANATYGGSPGHLVTITDEAENEFVRVTFPSVNLWLALRSTDPSVQPRTWSWIAGLETGTAVWRGNNVASGGGPLNGAYANWATSEPGTGNEPCGMFRPDGTWHDYGCGGPTFGVVVEFDSTTTTTTQTTATMTTHTIPLQFNRNITSAISTLQTENIMQSAMISTLQMSLSTAISTIHVLQSDAVTTLAGLNSADSQMLSTIEQIVVDNSSHNARLDALEPLVAHISTGITQALLQVPTVDIPSATTCTGSGCIPSVTAQSADILVQAPGGNVNFVTMQCGTVDPCTTLQQVQSLASALHALRGT